MNWNEVCEIRHMREKYPKSCPSLPALSTPHHRGKSCPSLPALSTPHHRGKSCPSLPALSTPLSSPHQRGTSCPSLPALSTPMSTPHRGKSCPSLPVMLCTTPGHYHLSLPRFELESTVAPPPRASCDISNCC